MPFYATTSSGLVNGQSPHHIDKCTRNVVASVFHYACAPAPAALDDSGPGTRFLPLAPESVERSKVTCRGMRRREWHATCDAAPTQASCSFVLYFDRSNDVIAR
jgi:hypothetical protein